MYLNSVVEDIQQFQSYKASRSWNFAGMFDTYTATAGTNKWMDEGKGSIVYCI
jgi:hypothetical protein